MMQRYFLNLVRIEIHVRSRHYNLTIKTSLGALMGAAMAVWYLIERFFDKGYARKG